MKSLLLILCLLVAAGFTPHPVRAAEPDTKPFELLDGDRVVFLGGTFFEREGKWGYIETALTSRFPDRNVTFRNLGYAGDTVRCEARTVCEGWANFGPPQEGFDRLKSLIAEIKPTVVFVAYGMGESFEGEKALPQFVADYNKLLDMLAGASGGKPRFVLIGPNYHEDLGRPLPDPTEHNRVLKLYSDAIGKIAGERGSPYVELFSSLRFKPTPNEPEAGYTDDGMHLTRFGYQRAAATIVGSLCGRPASHLEDLGTQQANALRELIVAKNADYFNYWRHENDTYTLGYRKHEQGKNAVEFPEFVKLAEEKDKEIARLRVPQPVTDRIEPKEKAGN